MARRTPRTNIDLVTGSPRAALFGSSRGFTIVELLIVIVVIAILAAITIVAYNGVAGRAIETSMQSDLKQAATALELDNLHGNGYPVDAAAANGGQGLRSSGDNALTYELKPYGYCVSVANPILSNDLVLRSSAGTIAEGTCDAAVSTFAGSTGGYVDDAGPAAQFNSPQGVAVDVSGAVYVADYSNNRIRKISPEGVVSTLAGSTQGFVDGTGAAAQFNRPYGVAVDSSGTVYVADYSNHRIRKVTPDGVVTTLAGSSYGYADGTGAAARFAYPRGVAVDGTGTLYVADSGNHRIRKITPDGVVTTLAGSAQGYADGTGAAAQFFFPYGLAFDRSGDIYVADTVNNRIRKITPAGVVTTVAGSTGGFADGTGTATQFSSPQGVVVDSSGTVYVSDFWNHRLRKITSAGVVTTVAGSTSGYVEGSGAVAQLNGPSGVAVDSAGTVYVADSMNHRIRKIEL